MYAIPTALTTMLKYRVSAIARAPATG